MRTTQRVGTAGENSMGEFSQTNSFDTLSPAYKKHDKINRRRTLDATLTGNDQKGFSTAVVPVKAEKERSVSEGRVCFPGGDEPTALKKQT